MQKKIIYILSITIGYFTITNAQPPSISWQKCYGGTNGEDGQSIRQTSDSGYLIGASVISSDGDVIGNHSPNHVDYWVFKIDSLGVLQWQRCYGSSGDDWLYSMELTFDHGFVMAGWAGTNDGDVSGAHGGADYWIVKCDSLGGIQWQKCFGGSTDDVPESIIETFDRGFLIAGTTDSNDSDIIGSGSHTTAICPGCREVWVIKLDSIGSIQWKKCYGGTWSDGGFAVIQLRDSGYVFAAKTSSDDGDVSYLHGGTHGSQGLPDYWIVKTNSLGNIEWEKSLGGTWDDIPSKIISTIDGGYLVIGNSFSTDFDVVGLHGSIEDAWIVKLDSIGNIEWQKCLGGTNYEDASGVIQTEDSGYVILSYSNSIDGDVNGNHSSGADAWLVKLDKTGSIQWQKCLGGNSDEALYDFKRTQDNGLILTGITLSNDGDVSGNHGNSDVWVVKLSSLQDGILVPEYFITDYFYYYDPDIQSIILSFYTQKIERMTFQLFDVTGRLLLSKLLTAKEGFNDQSTYVGEINTGVYLIQLVGEGNMFTKKLIVQ